MVHRIFDALDSALSAVVPLLYLVGLAVGTVAYFSGLVVRFDIAVGVCLAVAAECHSYLVQRRMRMALAQLSRASVQDNLYGALEAQYTRQRNILIALIVFSAYNSIQFVASTWHPDGWLPAQLQILLRGAIVPVLFYLAGELTPLITEPGDVLAHASREMTFAAVRTVSRQWARRLRRARRRNLDLSPIAITLLNDAGDIPGASRLQRIAEGLSAAEEGRMPALPAMTVAAATSGLVSHVPHAQENAVDLPPEKPPTGPGSPSVQVTASKRRRAVAASPAVLRLEAPHRPAAEHRIRVYLEAHPKASVRTIARRCGVSESTASKHRALWLQRREQQAALAQ